MVAGWDPEIHSDGWLSMIQAYILRRNLKRRR
jgi:hypothetical protein